MMIKAQYDEQGNITLEPVNEDHRKAYSEHMGAATGHVTCTASITKGEPVEDFLKHDFPSELLEDLNAGYAEYEEYTELFGYYLGWGADSVAIGE